MTEIRPIAHGEADTFLRLMCSCFELDYARARSAFFTEPFFDLSRKWALFESGRMISILTTTPLFFGHGAAVGIAGVATLPELRGCGHARRLITHILDNYREPAILFARDERLYESCGFETVDNVVRGEVISDPSWDTMGSCEVDRVKQVYSEWSHKDRSRLIRDERRWRLWLWNFRVCGAFADGYLASEPATLREGIYSGAPERLPVPEGTEWFGLEGMLEHLQVPLLEGRREMVMMTRDCPWKPLLFMTDQF